MIHRFILLLGPLRTHERYDNEIIALRERTKATTLNTVEACLVVTASFEVVKPRLDSLLFYQVSLPDPVP